MIVNGCKTRFQFSPVGDSTLSSTWPVPVFVPAAAAPAPAMRITTNFLKSLLDVGLLCPEFQPQPKRTQMSAISSRS
jgi:hypothetical protein